MMTVGLRPAAFGPGDPGTQSAQQPNAQDVARIGAITGAASTVTAAQIPAAVMPADQVDETAAAEARRLPPELVAPQPAERDAERADPAVAQPGAGPLKTFAQIPTEVMQEISRLREEAAAENVAGIPGRNDPTPMPASPAAIGAGAMPYDAA
jgi:hypothetical protein